MKKYIFAIIFLICIGSLFGAWADFSYYQEHIISASSGAGTNYQFNLTVYKGTGTSSGSSVYLETHCQDDFDDVVVFDNDQTTRLDSWIESTVSGTSCELWFELADDVSTSACTVYVAYGDADGTSLSDGSNTFAVFDDFNSALSSSLWDDSNDAGITYSTSSGDLLVTGNASRGYITSVSSIQTGCSMFANIKLNDESQAFSHPFGMVQDANNSVDIYGGTNDDKWAHATKEDGTTSTVTSTIGDLELDYVIWELTWLDNSSKLSMDGALEHTSATNVNDPTDNPIYIKIARGSLTTDTAYLDWIAVRKLIATEPAHSTWGSETAIGGGSSITIDQINGRDVSDIEFYVP